MSGLQEYTLVTCYILPPMHCRTPFRLGITSSHFSSAFKRGSCQTLPVLAMSIGSAQKDAASAHACVCSRKRKGAGAFLVVWQSHGIKRIVCACICKEGQSTFMAPKLLLQFKM